MIVDEDLASHAGEAEHKATFEALAADVATMDDDFPFLLFPVRIETRFMRVAVPVERDWDDVAPVTDGVTRVRLALARLGATSLTKGEGKKARKAALREIEEAVTGVEEAVRSVSFAREEVFGTTRPRKLGPSPIESELDRVLVRVGRLPSKFIQTRMSGRLEKLREPLRIVAATIEDEPFARFKRELEVKDADEVDRLLDRALRLASAERVDARALRELLEPLASGLVVLGDPPEIDGVRGRADRLRGILSRLADDARASGGNTEFEAALASASSMVRPPRTIERDEILRTSASLADLRGHLDDIKRRPQPLARRIKRPQRSNPTFERLVRETPFLPRHLEREAEEVAASAVAARRRRPAASAPWVAVRRKVKRLGHELWVRIMPDDVVVDSFEGDLTADEIESGRRYRAAVRHAGADEQLVKDAWVKLCREHGPQRAAWIALRVRVTQHPTDGSTALRAALTDVIETLGECAAARRGLSPNEAQALTLLRSATARLGGLGAVPARLASESKLAIQNRTRSIAGRLAGLAALSEDSDWREACDEGTASARAVAEAAAAAPVDNALPDVVDRPAEKTGAWTRAATAPLLPHRFVVVLLNRDPTQAAEQKSGGPPEAFAVRHVRVGNPIPADLMVGPDPTVGLNAYALDGATGELTVDASIQWMVDFEQAVAKGMAIRVPISEADAAAGFDRVYVVGTQRRLPAEGSSGTALRGHALLKRWVESHRFGGEGAAFLPIGSPTNNGEDDRSAYASQEDPQAAFALERGEPQFDTGVAAPVADGLRMARALGLQPSVVHRLACAGTLGVARTRWVHEALYSATLGEYLRSFSGLVLGHEMRETIGSFFREWVVPRGALPALRIGRQPYGVLPTTSFRRFAPPAARNERLLWRFLNGMADDFTKLRMARVRHAHEAGVTDPQQHFLDLVGQQATSVGAEYRFAMNVASRHPVQLPGTPNLWLGMVSELKGEESVRLGPAALIDRYIDLVREAEGIPANVPLTKNGKFMEAFYLLYNRMMDARAFEVRHLDNAKPLPLAVVKDDFATWLAEAVKRSPRELQTEVRAATSDQTILQVLVRHALLGAFRDCALVIVDRRLNVEFDTTGLGWSNAFLVRSLRGDYTITEWNMLFSPVRALDGLVGYKFDTAFFQRLAAEPPETSFADVIAQKGPSPLLDRVAPAGSPERQPFLDHLAALTARFDAVARLSTVPLDELRRLTIEHIDALVYRLDAWMLGFATQKLEAMRVAKPKGIFVGAFGCVEDLRPVSRTLTTDVPAELSTRPVYAADGNQGYVLTPSLDHAVTAAILRGGYVSDHVEPDVDNRLAVNLSSRRVRAALQIMDALRGGIELGTALGYQLERSLHDAYAQSGVTLDGFIGSLRRAFPGRPAVDPATDDPDRALRLVLDGLSLLGTVRAAIGATTAPSLRDAMRAGGAYPAHPWGLVEPETGDPIVARTDVARLDALIAAIDGIADTLDAVGDLSVSEGVYQIARGNHPRAAAMFGALASGKAPPRPEIVDTPVRGTLVSHRVVLQLPVSDADVIGWTAPTPRACAAPDLDAWLLELAGPAEVVIANVMKADGQRSPVKLGALGLRPVDLLAMAGSEQSRLELDARLLWTAREGAPKPIGTVDYEPRFMSFLGVLGLVADLLAKSRPAVASDYEVAAGAVPRADGVDLGELRVRVQSVTDALRDHALELAKLLTDRLAVPPKVLDGDPTERIRDEGWNLRRKDRLVADAGAIIADWTRWAELLFAGGLFKLAPSAPPSLELEGAELAEALLESVEATFVTAVRRWQLASAKVGVAVTALELTKLASELLQESVIIVPRVLVAPSVGLQAALDDPISDGALLAEEWLAGVSAVREPLRHLMQVRLCSEGLGVDPDAMRPLQQPHNLREAWVGVAALEDPSDRLSLVLVRPGAFTPNSLSAGLVLDQWHERIPSSTHNAGVAFHYNRPDAMAPQTLLLVVPPRRTGRWAFDDLLHAVHDTLELSKLRLVEPDHLDTSVYGQILPPIVGEILATEAPPNPMIADERVPLDFGCLAPPPPPQPT